MNEKQVEVLKSVMQFSCSLPFHMICRISRDLKNFRALSMYVILTMFVPWPCMLYWPCSCPDNVRALTMYVILTMFVPWSCLLYWPCSCPDHVCYIDHVRALIMYVIKVCFLKINGVSTITDIIFIKCKLKCMHIYQVWDHDCIVLVSNSSTLYHLQNM